MITIAAVAGLPEIARGDDLAALMLEAGAKPLGTDVVLVAHKAISKAEGRVRSLEEIDPSPRARELASAHGKDARHVQAILDESTEILRAERGVLIARTPHGFVCANAGVDASNTAADGELVLLPLDPDASARRLRARLHDLGGTAPAVVITDSFGRAWRNGLTDVTIGCAGLLPLDDWRGRADAAGRPLHATWIATADALAAAGDLARGKDSGEPIVILSGLGHHVTSADGPGAYALIRPSDEDLFR